MKDRQFEYLGVIPTGCWNPIKKETAKSDITRFGITFIPKNLHLFVGFDNAFHSLEGEEDMETPKGLRKPTKEEINAWCLLGKISVKGEEATEVMEASRSLFLGQEDLPDWKLELKGRGSRYNHLPDLMLKNAVNQLRKSNKTND